MGADHATLSTWKTADLIARDQKLHARTEVLGISLDAAVIHVVVLACTAGVSLPIHIAFCFWHAQRYDKAMEERASIRQILEGRKVKYQGKGKWVDPAVTDVKV